MVNARDLNGADIASSATGSAGLSSVNAPRDATGNLEVALSLAQAGLPVLPVWVTPNPATGAWDKPPAIKGWQTYATTDPEQIAQWWRRFPDAVPGIELHRAGLVVIDADRHGGPDGVAALHELMAMHGETARVPVTRSAGGGEHHYFRQPEAERFGNSRGSLPSGIDVRGDGAFIIAPGSIRPDGAIWAGDENTPKLIEAFKRNEIPVLPAWLADHLRPKFARRTRPSANRLRQRGSWPTRARRWRVALRNWPVLCGAIETRS
jgi:hypothetical protein